MKNAKNLLTKAVVGTTMTVTVVTSMTLPSIGRDNLSFFCDTYKGEYATKVRTVRGNKPIAIYDNWGNRSGWTAKRRCEKVSYRFQKFYEYGLLRYIRTGKIGKYSVICVTPQKNISCRKHHVLLTLNTGVNPQTALVRLVSQGEGDVSYSDVIRIASQNSPQVSYFSTDNQGHLYVDVEKLIHISPIE